MLTLLNKSKEAGFNLLELMIVMSLGLIVVGGAMNVFLATSNSNRDFLNSIRLHGEMRGVMSFMTRDLRRAGSWNFKIINDAEIAANTPEDDRTTMADNPFNGAEIAGTPICDPTILECVYSCVEYTYDLNLDGSDLDEDLDKDESELFGFGFEDGVIKIRQGGTTCAAGMAGWESVTDDSNVRITNFEIIDWYPQSYGRTQIRLLEIRITGNLVSDAATSRELVDYVRIRNDFILPPP